MVELNAKVKLCSVGCFFFTVTNPSDLEPICIPSPVFFLIVTKARLTTTSCSQNHRMQKKKQAGAQWLQLKRLVWTHAIVTVKLELIKRKAENSVGNLILLCFALVLC